MISIRTPRLELRPLDEADAELLRALLAEPSVAEWWGPEDDGFPLTDDPDAARLTILSDGAVAGLIQFYEEVHPNYHHAAIDLYLGSAFQGRGLGTEALTALVDWLVSARGHHRITIDPASENAAAIRAYESVGFTRVGTLRRAWRHHPSLQWRDSLLMEWLRED